MFGHRIGRGLGIAIVLVACTAPESEEVGRSSQALSCRSVPLVASVTHKPTHHQDGSVDLAPPLQFALPAEIPVTQGNAGNQYAVFSFSLGDVETRCRYRSPGVPHPHTTAQLAAASHYLFEECTQTGGDDDCDCDDDDHGHDDHGSDHGHGHDDHGNHGHDCDHDDHGNHHGHGHHAPPPPPHPGDTVTASHAELTIDGDDKAGTTRAQIDLVELAPCAGGGGGNGGAGGTANGGATASGGANGSGGAITTGVGASTASSTTSASSTSGSTVDTSVAATTGVTSGGGGVTSGVSAGGESTTGSTTSAVTTGAPDLCDGVDIDDQNACTADACDSITGVVTHVVTEGATCADPDGNLCNGVGVCDAAGICQPGGPLPVIDDGDPSTIDTCEAGVVVHRQAPPLDTSGTTTALDQWAFLYSGPDPIQTGVVPGTIGFVQAALVQGNVQLPDGSGAMGATVTVLDHAELGVAHTDVHGHFMMAVNGGGPLVLDVVLPGYLEMQRNVTPSWQGTTSADDIVLVAPDPNVTFVDLDGLSDVATAEGTVTVDDRGARQATVLLAPGTTALMTFADGSTQPLSTLSLRVTEFTVGPDGPARMPAALPSNSSYTYAIDINADEAVAAGAEHVVLSQPALYFVDNFLGAPVGTILPIGTYEPSRGVWVSEPSGRVLEILDTAGGIASIDLDGDGIAEDDATLAAEGLDLSERQRLATLYVPNTELWFAAMRHLSKPDINFPWGPQPDDYRPTALTTPNTTPLSCEAEIETSSTIECTNQVLGETVPVTGTPYSLSYRSGRTDGGTQSKRTTKLPLTQEAPPASLDSIHAILSIAGRTFDTTVACPCGANMSWSAPWDGTDAMGRKVVGSAQAEYEVEYRFRAADYASPTTPGQDFDISGGTTTFASSGSPRIFPVNYHLSFPMGAWRAESLGLGGLTLSAVHAYDAVSRTLHFGSGATRILPADALSNRLVTKRPYLGNVRQMFSLADGSLILSVASGLGSIEYIDRVAPDGATTHILGGPGCTVGVIEGPGGCVPGIEAMTVAPDGNIYMTTSHVGFSDGYYVLRLSLEGVLHHLAGAGPRNPDQLTPLGDDGRATDAQLGLSLAIAVSRAGTVYIRDGLALRKIEPGGIISTIGHPISTLPQAAEGPLDQISVIGFSELAIDSSDRLLFTWAGSDTTRWFRVEPGGYVRLVAGAGQVSTLEGVPATSAKLDRGRLIVPDNHDGFYLLTIRPSVFNTSEAILVHVDQLGVARTVAGIAGACTDSNCGVPGPALDAHLSPTYAIGALTLQPNGDIVYLSSAGVFQIASAFPELSPDATRFIPSEDGRELYVFDRDGRHLETRDAVRGTVTLSIGYDANGHVDSLTDQDGLATTVERDTDGEPTAIVGPYGQRTELVVGSSGYVEQIIDPSGASNSFGYEPGGLLASFTSRTGHTATYLYDSEGRLIHDEAPDGTAIELTRQPRDDGLEVTMTTPLGRQSTHSYITLPTGNTETTVIDPAGLVHKTVRYNRDISVATAPNGTVTTVERNADPRWLTLAPNTHSTTQLPSGLTRTVDFSRAVTLQSASDPLSLLTQTETSTIAGRTWTQTYSTTTRQETRTTPEGRISEMRYDDHGRVIEMTYPDTLPIALAYDGQGRLVSTSQGSRVSSRTYGVDGLLESVTDPLAQTTSYARDLNGRVTAETRNDLAVTAYGYDGEDHTTGVTPPGKPEHGMTYNNVELLAGYQPPDLSSGAAPTTYEYDLDKALTQVSQPGGATIDYAYDAAGRVQTTTFPTGQIERTYDPVSGQLTHLGGPTGVDLDFTFDGNLRTSTSWSGLVAGSVEWVYDNSFRVVTETVNGAWNAAFTYDDDDLLMQAGALSIFRDPESGRVTGTTAGTVSDAWAYNPYGEPSGYAATAGGSPLLSFAYERDDLGRITKKTEIRNGGAARVLQYGYDDAGRLETVTEDGGLVESYGYDANGNRTSSMNSSGVFSATYDDQDRIETYGSMVYGFTDNGELESKLDTSTGDLTTYEYDALGNLRGVVLPDGTEIEYLVDGQGRRVGKLVDGVLEQAWLWRGQLQPVAELDGAGNVVARYVYAGGVNVPEAIVMASGPTYRLVKDHLGSVRMVVDEASGAVVQELAYDAWGRVVVDTNPGLQPFGFAGGLYDGETGLVRFGARDYDAETGRWTRKDPIRFAAGDGDLYGYAKADPTDRRDPRGLTVYECCASAASVGGLGAALPDHCWICTDNNCAGLTGSLLDTRIETHPDSVTSVVYPNAVCAEVPSVNESCVDAVVNATLWSHPGLFSPWNNCQSYVGDVIDTCYDWASVPDEQQSGPCLSCGEGM